MLVLDHITQTCELDEFVYHEMLTHVPLVAHGRARRVLIIGGGDGGALREVLRHPVERATMVELDPDVVRYCRKYLPSVSAGAFDDPRTELIFGDGAEYVRKTRETFDVVITDSPDPIGPAKVLFSIGFYRDVLRVLSPHGIAVRQAGSAMLQGGELPAARRKLRRVFPNVGVYLAAVPTYVGGLFSFLMGAKAPGGLQLSRQQIENRLRRLRLKTRYYNAEIHRACFALPNHVKERLK